MQYDDEAMPFANQIEEMAKAYILSLKDNGFVFINLEEEGKNLLLDEIFDILFRLRASYRSMGRFMSSNEMLDMTENHITKLRQLFEAQNNKGFFATTNKTKCFLNSIALENNLNIKLLLLSQKCQFGKDLMEIIIEREKNIYENLAIENVISKNRY